MRLLIVLLLLWPALGSADVQSMSIARDVPRDAATRQAIQAAEAVMHEFIRTFNSRDEQAWSGTLLFPHVRVASGTVVVTPTRNEFVAATDLDAFAEANNWSYSQWDAMQVIQAGPDKVHFKVTFSRFNPQGERYATFNSLYVLQNTPAGWGIRLRSSFAP